VLLSYVLAEKYQEMMVIAQSHKRLVAILSHSNLVMADYHAEYDKVSICLSNRLLQCKRERCE